MSEQNTQVKRRRVFHIPGYDPIHPRRYRELYRTEGAAQAKISGYGIEVKAHASGGSFCWLTKAHIQEKKVLARIDVLVWSDIVRASMAQTIPATYWQLVQTAWVYISTGTLRRLMWMRKGPVIAALYPIIMLLLQLFIALVIGAFLGGALQSALMWLLGLTDLTQGVVFDAVSWIALLMKVMIWAGVVAILLHWFKSKDHKLFAYYLMHDYAFSARHWGATPPALEARLKTFGAQIASALDDDVDEVLVVGHSSGAHLAISTLADLLRAGKARRNGPKLALLTLGQVVPMVSFLPKARRLRSDLAYLSASDAITWVDVSAPGDGCCFALCDPVAVTGVTPPGKHWPLVVSAAFTQSLTPGRWKELRWRFFRLHFQYLCAFDRPKDYDYFQITAGPLTLSDRYRDRPPSQSRIDVAVSRYTSLAP